ncbi:MAG TPA: hypothetical protein VEY14_10030 [Nocardioidaceae bacterium]|jgi:hypothetical protein|nr:hypothetical protein [Nocardioidaceae bacterium]
MSAERPDEVDEEFNRIVGGLGPGWGSGLPAWPDPQDASDTGDDIDEPAVVGPSEPPAAPVPSPGAATPSAEEEHFSPGPPPPLPRPEPVTVLCWFLVLGAPIGMVLLTLAGWYVPRWVLGLIGVGFVAGVVTLVLRLDNHPRDTDSGAVV